MHVDPAANLVQRYASALAGQLRDFAPVGLVGQSPGNTEVRASGSTRRYGQASGSARLQSKLVGRVVILQPADKR